LFLAPQALPFLGPLGSFDAEGGGAQIGMGASVASDAVLEPGARVEMGADVGPRAVVRADAVVRMGASVGADAVIERGAVVSWGASVHKSAVVEAGATVGAGSDVLAGARVPAGMWLRPGSTFGGRSAPQVEAPRPVPPVSESDPRQARVAAVCGKLEAELRAAPERVREFLGGSPEAVASLRGTCEDLAQRERELYEGRPSPGSGELSDRIPGKCPGDGLNEMPSLSRRGHQALLNQCKANLAAAEAEVAAASLGTSIAVATPHGYAPNEEIVAAAKKIARGTGAIIEITEDPIKAVTGANAIYTDVWASMGQEAQAAERAKIFAPYQVTEKLFGHASPHGVFMHCLPAHRGEEVVASVIDSPRSIVFDQAENRMHVQKAILLLLLGSGMRTMPARSNHA